MREILSSVKQCYESYGPFGVDLGDQTLVLNKINDLLSPYCGTDLFRNYPQKQYENTFLKDGSRLGDNLTVTGNIKEQAPAVTAVASGGNILEKVNGYKVHIFYSSGTITFSTAGRVEYLMIAGGGGGAVTVRQAAEVWFSLAWISSSRSSTLALRALWIRARGSTRLGQRQVARLTGAFSLPWPWRGLPIMSVSLLLVLARVIIKDRVILALANTLVALRARPSQAH